MKINGKTIANKIIRHLKRDLSELNKNGYEKPKLVVFSVKPTPEESVFIRNKMKVAKKIGIDFEIVLYRREPKFESFVKRIRTYDLDPEVTAIIVQKPLPASLSTVSLFNYIGLEKEIEGFKKKTPYIPPIGLAILTVFKYIYTPSNKKLVENLLVDLDKDIPVFKQALRRKKIVLLGRGETGGKPVGVTLTRAKINYINLSSKTPKPETFINEADVIISAVGKTVLKPEFLKQGVILIGVGIRKENDKWVGDYTDTKIKETASYYTPTPGGIGPLTVAYLLHNVVRASKRQGRKKE